MSDVLTAEEEARIKALGAPSDPNANIKWTDGNKVNKISRRTWTTKSPEVRLKRAQLDLLAAGLEEEARLLTGTRLNTAWQRLDQKVRGDLMAERSQTAATEPAAKKKRLRRKDGKRNLLCPPCHLWCSERLTLAATSNLTIARSLGVKSGFEGDSDSNHASEAPSPALEQEVLGFSIDVVLSDADADPRIERRPLVGAVLVEANMFDPKAQSVLVVRCSGAGLASNVNKPVKVDERTVEFRIVRNNKPDVTSWIHANNQRVSEEDLAEYRSNAHDLLKNKYGNHMGYEVLNTAFQALVPRVEEWWVAVKVPPPYMFGELDDSILLCAQSQIDVLCTLPLVKETPNVDKSPAVLMAKSSV
jgi:hypothetical protein